MSDDEIDDNAVYRITGKGLHAIGELTDNGLRHFQLREQECEELRYMIECSNEACEFLYDALIEIRDATADPVVVGIVDEGLASVRPVIYEETNEKREENE